MREREMRQILTQSRRVGKYFVSFKENNNFSKNYLIYTQYNLKNNNNSKKKNNNLSRGIVFLMC